VKTPRKQRINLVEKLDRHNSEGIRCYFNEPEGTYIDVHVHESMPDKLVVRSGHGYLDVEPVAANVVYIKLRDHGEVA
jgi:hypothetical protein